MVCGLWFDNLLRHTRFAYTDGAHWFFKYYTTQVLGGFQALETVGGSLQVNDNSKLVAFLAFGQLTSVDANLEITNNPLLPLTAITPVMCSNVLAYPSPFNQSFRLNASPKASIEAIDARGQRVFIGTNEAALGADRPSGVYAVVVREGDRRSVLRVVKE